jgi:hypothetical protein
LTNIKLYIQLKIMMGKESLKCKIFDRRLLSSTLEEQMNIFFNDNSDIKIVYISKEDDSVIVVYRQKIKK